MVSAKLFSKHALACYKGGFNQSDTHEPDVDILERGDMNSIAIG